MLPHLESLKSDYKYKLVIEFGIVLCFSGIYYNFDMPVGLYKPIREHFKDQPMIYNNFEIYYNFLYGAMAWINIFFPILLGTRFLLAMVSGCNFFGATFLYIGCIVKDFQLMIFGRFVVGVAIGSIFPIASKIVIPYFKAQNLTFVQSFNLGMACLFDALCAIMSPVIAAEFSLEVAIGLGAVASIFGIIGCFIANMLDTKAEKEIIAKSILGYVIKSFNFEFWLIAIFMGLNFASYIGSEANLVPILEDTLKFKHVEEIVDEKVDIYTHSAIIGCFLAPVFVLPISGFIVDIKGWHCEQAIFASLLQSTIQFSVYYIDGILYAILLGTCFSLFISSLWSTVPYLIDKEILGAGYGILMSLKFLGVTLATILIGYMSNGEAEGQKYVGSQFVMGFLNVIAAFIAIILKNRFKQLNILGYGDSDNSKKKDKQYEMIGVDKINE